MKIVILYNNEYPGFTPGYNRVRYYVRGLEQSGAMVSVLPVYLNGGSFLKQLWNSFIMPFVILGRHKQDIRNADHLIVYEFNWWTYLVLKIFKPTSLRTHLEVNEKPEAVYSSRFFELPPVKKFNMAMTRLSFRWFDGFIAISEPLRVYIRQYAGPNARIIVLPVLADPYARAAPSDYPIPAHPYTVHSGALSQIKDGMIGTFQAFADANKQLQGQLHFYLTSKVAPREVLEDIEGIIAREGIQENVHFVGRLEENDLRRLQANCDFVVINKPDNEQNRYNFPTKLGEYLTLAKPVIATKVGDLTQYLTDMQSAILLVPGDTIALTAAMVRLVQDKDLADKIGKGGKRVAEEQLNYAVNGQRLKEYLEGFTKK